MRLKPQTYALTAVCHERRRVFQQTTIAELLIDTLLRYRDQGRFLLHAFAIMPDHVHLLLTPSESIEKTAQLVKGGFSFAVRKLYSGEVWQAGYYAHRVTDARDYLQQMTYIAENPVRKRYTSHRFVHTNGEWTIHLKLLPRTCPVPGAEARFLPILDVSGLKPRPIFAAMRYS